MSEKLFNRNYLLLILITFCSGLTAQLLNTALPLFMVNALDSSTTLSGLLAALYTIVACVFRPISGIWVDRFGRKGFTLGGLAVFVWGCIGFGLSKDVSALIFYRCLQGVGFGISATAASAAASDNIPAARLGEGLGYLGMSNSLPMLVGPSLALAMISIGSYSYPFLGGGILLIIAFLLAAFTTEDKSSFKQQKRQKFHISDLYEKRALVPSIIQFFLAFSACTGMVYGALFAQDRGYTNISLFFVISALGMICIRLVISKAVDRLNAYYFVIPACFVWALSDVVMLVSHNQNVFLICGLVYGVCLGVAQTLLNTVALRGVPKNRRGAANATFLFCFDGGIGIGASVLGALIDATSYDTMVVVCTVAAVIGGLLGILAKKNGGGDPETGMNT